MRDVKTLGLLGTGVIGAGWAARALHLGYDVVASDPHPRAERQLREAIDNAEPALAKLVFAPLPQKGRLRFTTDPDEVAASADFVQENAPEDLALKQRVLAGIDAAAPADVVVASSTSGLLPSDLARDMRHPGRFCVGHPFNPVYLLPLAEVVGGERTAPETLEAARRFYTDLGMHALLVRREIPGHLSDRLQEAMWREILHIVNDGVASTDELDQSIAYGPGLRWAVMGTCLVFHLAGGEAGMRHMLEQFGPALKLPWTRLEAPELTETLIDRMVEGTQAQAAGRSIRELERLRDDCLVAIMQVLREHGVGAGGTLRALEDRLYARVTARRAGEEDDEDLARPLRLHECRVRPEWVDYNGHMTESRYLQVFGDASDALLQYVGVDDAYRAQGHSYYTVETHILHTGEAGTLEPVHVTTQLLHVDDKRLHVFHTMRRSDGDDELATAEQMLLHVDTRRGRAAPAGAAVRAVLDRIRDGHRALDPPPRAGRHVGMRAG